MICGYDKEQPDSVLEKRILLCQKIRLNMIYCAIPINDPQIRDLLHAFVSESLLLLHVGLIRPNDITSIFTHGASLGAIYVYPIFYVLNAYTQYSSHFHCPQFVSSYNNTMIIDIALLE